jgi:hypothetical protein
VKTSENSLIISRVTTIFKMLPPGLIVTDMNQCHLLKQISVKKQKSAFLLPLTQIFLGSILKKLDIEKKMCGVFLIKIRKTPINQEI